jgi:hypothetical protein
MPRRLLDRASPLLDLESYSRPGPAQREQLSPAQIDYIARTVHRTPEVMVKVLSKGAQDVKAVTRHFNYLTRDGEVEIETDDGQRLRAEGVAETLVEDWDLDLEEVRPNADLMPRETRRPPRLVHKLMFSMPARTAPHKVLDAVRNFAREEFGAKHRYAMVLHTDEPHPHVHVVVKAMSEEGKRLNIRKATLREWRKEFARHLRQQGVRANASARAARGAIRPQKLDGIHRAAMRGVSTHYRRKVNSVAWELAQGTLRAEPGKERLVATRRAVVQGWMDVSDQLIRQGQLELAREVRIFAAQLPPSLTEKEAIRAALLQNVRARDPREPTQ